MSRKRDKITVPKLSQAEKKTLEILRRHKIYRPKNPRAAPTRHAKTLARKFLDLATGQAQIVTTRSAKKGRKGYVEAHALKNGDKIGTVRARRNKLIVPHHPGERVSYSAKTGEYIVRTNMGEITFERRPLKKHMRTLRELRDQLKPGDRVAVPLFRGHKLGVDWQSMSIEEFEQFWSLYGPNASKREYTGLADHVARFVIRDSREFARHAKN